MLTATCEKYPQLIVNKVCRFRDGKARVNAEQAAKLRRLGAEYEITVEGSDEPDGGAEKPLEKRTAAELKKYAKDNSIDLGGATKKPEILAAIAAQSANADEEPAEDEEEPEGDEPDEDDDESSDED